MTKIIKPQKLTEGSTIAVISPSWGGPSVCPDIYKKGLQNLREIFGFTIKEYPTARMSNDELHKNPELRAEDINNAFADREVDAVFASIGGSDSIRILKYLDVDLILENPKIIMGFSDSVTFLSYLNQKGLVTFQGPSVMAGWAQMHNFDFLKSYYKSILMTNPPNREILSFPLWSSGYPDWNNIETIGQVQNLKKNPEGFRWLQGKRKVTGEIWGGCLEVIDWLKGTQYWPDSAFWKNKIYMIETSEEKPSPEEVGFSLRNLGVQGIFDQISGLIIGRPKDYTEDEKKQLYKTVVSIVAEEFGNSELPIVADMDFGHTDPNMIIPMGIKTEIDPAMKKISIIESIFQGEK